VNRSPHIVLSLALTLLVVLLAIPASAGSATRVRIIDKRFRPSNVTIERGTVVRWANTGNNNHTSTGPGWNSGTLNPGESFRRRFRQRGTFSYRCTIHAGMRGTIIVE